MPQAQVRDDSQSGMPRSPRKSVSGPRVIVALDYPDLAPVRRLTSQLDPASCRMKIGKELFTAYGPAAVELVRTAGFEVFLDLKFHDIPNTAAQAVRAAAALDVWMVNVHVSGGEAMLRACRDALLTLPDRPLLIGVTILTSMSDADIHAIGWSGSAEENVLRLAALAANAGLDGVVCSAREASALRRQLGDGFCLVTPGIRPAGVGADDQSRVMTPSEALRAGSDYLVVGRAITGAPDPVAALAAINAEIAVSSEA